MQTNLKESGTGMLELTAYPDGLTELDWQAITSANLRIKKPNTTSIFEITALVDKTAHSLLATIEVDVEGVWQVGGKFWFAGESVPTTSRTTDKFLVTDGFE